MDFSKLEEILQDEPSFRRRQILEAVFEKLISDWQEATNLPQKLKQKLEKKFPLTIKGEFLESEQKNVSKGVIHLEEDRKIETVLMRHQERNTVCVSTQLGCALACDFCLTAKMGFVRNLTAGEILSQVLFFARKLKQEQERVSNVVFMGMGEPFYNYDEFVKAFRVMNQNMGIGARKISVSTVGIIPGIQRLAEETEQVNLAVSLHAPTNELRSKLMPINNKYPLEELLSAVREYFQKTKRKVMIEYLMLEEVNDSPEQAKQLADLLISELGNNFMVNLISYNPTGKYKSSSPARIGEFRKVLEKGHRIDTVQRYKFGQDIKGACGQLAGESE